MCAGAVLGLAKRAALMRSASASRSENDADNGILPTVPGQFIGAAVSLWPDAQTAESDTHLVEIDAAWVGRVWITYRRVREPRFARWFWSAVRTSQEKNRGTFKKGEKSLAWAESPIGQSQRLRRACRMPDNARRFAGDFSADPLES